MNQIITTGIVLTRIDYQEADRILSMLTPDRGKVRLMARGVRRIKSKLAGGIELFSISQITFIKGKGDLDILASARLQTHYSNIVKDINRTMLGYELIKRINKITEDAADAEYYDLLASTFAGLDNLDIPNDAVEFWFTMQLLQITGHAPNLQTDALDQPLLPKNNYLFDYDAMAFQSDPNGPFTANHIKLFRLCINSHSPEVMLRVLDVDKILPEALILAKTTLSQSVRI